jgi:hypothetical protein
MRTELRPPPTVEDESHQSVIRGPKYFEIYLKRHIFKKAKIQEKGWIYGPIKFKYHPLSEIYYFLFI